MLQFKGENVLIIAPHPDDEVLGCGGLITKVKGAGGTVYVQFIVVGNTKDFSRKGRSNAKERTREIQSVMRYLRIDRYHIGFSERHHLRLDRVGQRSIMQLLERDSPVSIERVKPTIVVYPSPYSYNQDHVIVARAAHATLRPAESTTKHFVPTVLAFEVPADDWSLHHQQVPNYFVRLTQREIETKRKALTLYTSQVRPFPNPRSEQAVTALAQLRGSLCDAPFAEAFLVYRHVVA